jgi:hypothetical protein
MAEAPRGKAPSASPRGVQPAEPALPPLSVNFYRRMKPNRVYPFVVGWKPSQQYPPPPAGAVGPVVVRLLCAGAQVVPSEHLLDPTQPRATVSFYVTPLAKGWLRAVRLEVLQQGRKVQELPLPCKAARQRLTWLLLALTFLVTYFVATYLQYSPVTYKLLARDVAKKEAPPRSPGDALTRHLNDNMPRDPAWLANALKAVNEKLGEFYDLVYYWGGWEARTDPKPLALFTALVMLFFTLLSAILHAERRRRRTGKPVPLLAAGAPVAPVPLTVPAPRRGDAMAVEKVG